MEAEAKTSRAAAFGYRAALVMKKIQAAERWLLARSGAHRRRVKGVFILIKTALALSVIVISLWTLVVLVPLMLLAMLIASDVQDGHALSSSASPCQDEEEADGLRFGWQGLGYYLGGFRIDSRDD